MQCPAAPANHTEPNAGSNVMDTFGRARAAARSIAMLSDDERRRVLLDVADEIDSRHAELLEANRHDLDRMASDNPLYDRLQLTAARLTSIASDMRHVAMLPSPLMQTLEERTLPNGLRLTKRSVPFGVIGIVYEARPNVTYDVFSLCFKSGNACLLKGGRDADLSNRAGVELIRGVLQRHAICPDAVQLLPATHEATAQLLAAVGQVDLVIPRGSRHLIDFVRQTAKVPVIETGAGVVNTYVDRAADIGMAARIVLNAKTRRVSVCNALDCLIVHKALLPQLNIICGPLASKDVTIYADEQAYTSLCGSYPSALLQHATTESFGTEFMDYKMAIRTVDGLQQALDHIARYGSGHSEAIVTTDDVNAHRFQNEVDAACVYVNAPTSFTDGAQFGLGAEIGISTQKLGPRGPMGLDELTTYKWLIDGNGQVRP